MTKPKRKHTGGRPQVMDDRVKRTVYFDAEMWEAIGREANMEEVSASDLIRTVMGAWLAGRGA